MILVLAGYERHDTTERGMVSVARVHLERGHVGAERAERAVRRRVFSRVARARGVHAAQRAVLLTPGDPAEGDVGADRAVHDADPGQGAERFQPGPPDVIGEGRLGHGGHAGSEQQVQHGEEDRQRPPGQFVTGPVMLMRAVVRDRGGGA